MLRDWFGTLAHRKGDTAAAFDGPGAVLTALGASPSIGDVVYGARWAIEELSQGQPLLLIVDDLHWADASSMQALDLLSATLEQLPCLIVAGVRSGERVEAPDALSRLMAAGRVLSPQQLSKGAVADLVRSVRPMATDADIDDMHRTSGGVPFYVTEMLTGEGLPEAVVGSLSGRMDRLSPTAGQTAQAVCVLSDQASVGTVAELANLSIDVVAADLSALTAAHVLVATKGRHAPAQPIVCDGLMARLSATEVSDLHTRAAAVLTGRGASRAVVAAHLVKTLSGKDPGVRARLAEQGALALQAGAPDVAVDYLQRALEEGPVGPDDVLLLSTSARALSRTGHLDAALELWDKAAQLADEDTRMTLRAEAGDALVVAGRHRDAEAAYGELLTLDGPGAGKQKLLARMVMAGLLTGESSDYLRQQVDVVLGHPASDDTHEDRLNLAAGAVLLTFAGTDAAKARELAIRAVGGGSLLDEETADGSGLYLASGVLDWVSAFIEGEAVLTSAIEDARDRNSLMGLATAATCRGHLRTRMGMVSEALADLATAMAQREHGWNAYLAPLLSAQVECRIARGELDLAATHRDELEELSHVPGSTGAYATHALAELASAQADHERAAHLYAEVGRMVSERLDNPAILPWRAGESLARIRLGDTRAAVALARENLELARQFGAPYAVAQALRTVAAVDASIDRIAVLREALDVLRHTQAPRLEAQIATDLAGMVLLAHGMAQTSEVVALLRRAESYASFQELRPLGDRVHRLLERIGEPVKRSSAETLGSLTTSERRVADLAAAGLSNRQIAQQLFVTVKAVEWHLSNVYRKLGIRSRTRLPALLNVPAPRAAVMLEGAPARSA